jgi:hypothetical protein
MVLWGKAEVPELAHEPRVSWPGEPEGLGITTHLPTGLRLQEFQSDWNDRGMNREFYLTPPPGEEWRLEVVVRDGHPTIRARVRDHLELTLNDPIPHDTDVRLSGQMLVTHGQNFDCFAAAPAHGNPPARWTNERRDALVLMLFWALERFGRYNHHTYPTGPFPSTLQFQPHGVPEVLHGTFRNPVWERIQAGQ